MDPKQTLALLDELELLGFMDEAFWRLHHFRGKKRVTINGVQILLQEARLVSPGP